MVDLTDLFGEAGIEGVILFPDVNVEITLKCPGEAGETESE